MNLKFVSTDVSRTAFQNELIDDQFFLELVNKENLTKFSCPSSPALSDRVSLKTNRNVVFAYTLLCSFLEYSVSWENGDKAQGKGEENKGTDNKMGKESERRIEHQIESRSNKSPKLC